LRPTIAPSLEDRGAGVALLNKFGRLTGGGGFMRSGAIKHDFLVLGQVWQTGFEFSQGDGALKAQPPAFGFIIIGTDQEGFS
jgi:hypothetical protein